MFDSSISIILAFNDPERSRRVAGAGRRASIFYERFPTSLGELPGFVASIRCARRKPTVKRPSSPRPLRIVGRS
jgi:hypothetical protein